MKFYSIDTIVSVAKAQAPYYAEIYKDIDPANFQLQDMPLTDQKQYWEANSSEQKLGLTGSMTEGIVFKSGGTTGNPKFTVYASEEWRSMVEVFGQHQIFNKFRRGDRVGNLFYVGELYSSFIFLHDALKHCSEEILMFPLAGFAPKMTIYKTMKEFDVNAVLCVPTTILSFAEWIKEEGLEAPKLERVYFGGETFYPDQRKYMESVFPGVEIRSIGYASVDGGLLGFCSEDCGFNEHRQFDSYNVIEIIDEETGLPIEEVGVEGKMYTTNLSRLLMPVVRYPIGDRGVWKEEAGTRNRKFEIRGRSDECARFGPVSLYFEDVRRLLEKFSEKLRIASYQMQIDHFDNLDQLTIRVASELSREECEKSNSDILGKLEQSRVMIREEIDKGKIHPLAIDWVGADDIAINPRTGKLKRIIDNRF
jgi:phenylacetate-coenzyme A ligase PaaK-like adenylate-forming protein